MFSRLLSLIIKVEGHLKSKFKKKTEQPGLWGGGEESRGWAIERTGKRKQGAMGDEAGRREEDEAVGERQGSLGVSKLHGSF